MSVTSAATDAAQVRQGLVRALQLNLVGPEGVAEPDYARELLPEPPKTWYLTGFLAPTGASSEQRSAPAAQDELDLNGAPAETDGQGYADRSSARASLFPASIGLTAFVAAEEQALTAIIRWGDYQPEVVEAGEPVGPSEPQDGEEAAPTPWRRTPHEATMELPLSSTSPWPQPVPGSDGLMLHVQVQQLSDEAYGEDKLPPGALSVSVFLVNERAPRHGDEADCAYVFQVQVQLRSELGFLGRPNLRGVASAAHSDDWDEKLADLQYRDCHEFAVGHGVATTACEVQGDRAKAVETCWLPCVGVERVEAPAVPGVELGMAALAELSRDQVEAALLPLVTAYREWLGRQATSLQGLSAQRRATGDDLLKDASYAAQRMENGVRLLTDDAQVLEAFRTANAAMARANRQRTGTIRGVPPDEIEPPAWRPFQLAFQLMCLPGLVDPTSPERRCVDLLFFPTGGGKTEAYLGLAAFAMVHRRLVHGGRSSGGLSVLMRYTLRLLTLDQLDRAAGLVCALELARQARPEALGEWPFEIGLWVGGAASPNRLGGKGYNGPGKDDTAHEQLGKYKIDSEANPSPVPLASCPWCGTPLDAQHMRLVPHEKRPANLAVCCANRQCEFSGDQALPIVVVDEVIYRRLPAFLIATVDKFAALPWQGRVGALFGRVERYDKDGYYGPSDPELGQPLEAGLLPPPDLIIQDELHLITGPLGTVAGLYEVVIDALSTRREADRQELGPKIIASTATARRAQRQIKALFGRDDTAVFPPPVPNRRDSFFAETRQESVAPARWYIGAAAQGRSLKVVLLRVALTLLSAGQAAAEASGWPVADPYLTLLGYFNSLRELGGSRHLIEDQVVGQLRQYARRCRMEPSEALFVNREISPVPEELTSRERTAKVAAAKEGLQRPFPTDKAVDVALATNMISVGLDISRLGLMVVLGQPKGAAEYIQATSRVGRDRAKPGLVVTLLNVHKPRDRSHYERFVTWHESFYREVESASVTPFAPRALDQALAGVLVGLCRQSLPELNGPDGAAAVAQVRARLDEVIEVVVQRAGEQGEAVRARCVSLLDDWVWLATQTAEHNATLIYQEYEGSRKEKGKPLLRDLIESGSEEPSEREKRFRAGRSMRGVESQTELAVKPLVRQSMRNTLPSSQLLGPFGPGAMVDLPREAVLIAGLDQWSHDGCGGFEIEEPRLQAKLAGVLRRPTVDLRLPPPALDDQEANTRPGVDAYRFPQWYVANVAERTDDGWLRRPLVHRHGLDRRSRKYVDGEGQEHNVVAVRFVRACTKGHLDDIEWPGFAHSEYESPCRRQLWLEEWGTSGDLRSIHVACKCGARRPLTDLTVGGKQAMGFCPGRTPWLGADGDEGCGEPYRLLIRTASNAWFAQTMSALSIPPAADPLAAAVDRVWETIKAVPDAATLEILAVVPAVREALGPFKEAGRLEEVMAAVERKRGALAAPEAGGVSVKAEEFAALAAPQPTAVPDFQTQPLPWPAGPAWSEPVERVVLVHRLRQVTALLGFTRFEAAGADTTGELDPEVKRAPLSHSANWLPATENRGEGVFVQLKADVVNAWAQRPAVQERARAHGIALQTWSKARGNARRAQPPIAYLALHSLSHLLMTAIALDCGYPSSSLAERIYAEPDHYGLLILTSSAASEGTLGGLVEAGRRLEAHLRRALEAGGLCSNDPVCAKHQPNSSEHQQLNGAACHGCLLVAETSCEQGNDFLDRALVVPTMGHDPQLALFPRP